MVSIQSLTNDDNRLALLRKLDWRVRHAADSILTGEYRSTFRGKGMEFDQVVPYEFGDDVRDIDWNVTARLGEPYRKKFVEEREVTLLLVFQDTISLQFGSHNKTKRDALLELTVLLMLLGAANRDRTALFYTAPGESWFCEPATGRGKIMAHASHLLTQNPPSIKSKEEVDMSWKFLSHAVPRHSVCLWLGDFAGNPERPAGWSVLQRRYQTMGFRVEDPWERVLPDVGEMTAYDPVSGEMVVIHPGDSQQKQAHGDWVDSRDAFWKQLFPDPRSRLTLSSDEDGFDSLIRFLARRSMGGVR
ncbi:MAG: DUF58 domain-containing protein [Verrucomicrobiota bacterium]